MQKVALGTGVMLVVVGAFIALTHSSSNAVSLDWLKDTAGGEVRYCSGPDVSGTQRRSVEDFNKNPPDNKRAVPVFDAPADADGQRAWFHEAMDSGRCDIAYMDVAYMPEFADEDLLYDMTPYLHEHGLEQQFDDTMMQTVRYKGALWGVPKQLDGGVLFYRHRRVTTLPSSWQDVFQQSAAASNADLPGLRLPLDQYEGFTVVLLELAYAAGADPIVSDDGEARVNQPQVLEALKMLRDAVTQHALPLSSFRSKERGTLAVFRRGRAKFLRAWVYAAASIPEEAKDSRVLAQIAQRIKAISLPPWEGGRRLGVLGGHDLVIPRSAKNHEGALQLIRFLTSRPQLIRDAELGSLAPPVAGWQREDAVNDNQALNALAATPLVLRPQIPQYARVSAEIGNSLSSLLQGAGGATDNDLEQALRDIQDRVTKILAG
jgi:multiple sugar transport system substrate-binding protein